MRSQRLQIPTAMFTVFGLTLIALNAFVQAADVADANAVETNVYAASFEALIKLFVLAVLIESALSLIFNWRVFLEFFNKRAIKTIVMFAVSLLVVKTFKIDIVAQLMHQYGEGSEPGDLMSTILTAMIVAGGSSGVNNLFISLGFRSQVNDQPALPPRTEAWIAIMVHRANVVTGEVLVQISEDSSGSAAQHESIAGSVNARKGFKDLLFPNRNRFPASGGYTLESNKIYKISVSGKDESGKLVTALGDTYSFAPKAIVDLEVKL